MTLTTARNLLCAFGLGLPTSGPSGIVMGGHLRAARVFTAGWRRRRTFVFRGWLSVQHVRFGHCETLAQDGWHRGTGLRLIRARAHDLGSGPRRYRGRSVRLLFIVIAHVDDDANPAAAGRWSDVSGHRSTRRLFRRRTGRLANVVFAAAATHVPRAHRVVRLLRPSGRCAPIACTRGPFVAPGFGFIAAGPPRSFAAFDPRGLANTAVCLTCTTRVLHYCCSIRFVVRLHRFVVRVAPVHRVLSLWYFDPAPSLACRVRSVLELWFQL